AGGHLTLTLDEGQSTTPMRIELVYPASFLSNMAATILDNIILYLKDGNINPFPHYYAGDYWIEELN
uniref:hypothetical protein n=1 Tax=Marinobacterium profundum TaxID=1714300 RepID=UPI001C1F9889